MKLAIDAMGGDFAPQNIVAGVAEALRDNSENRDRLYLVGDQARIEAELRKLNFQDPRIEIVHASEVIEMDDPPVQSVRRKKDSSMNAARSTS
jgi:phosphate acyltransferase